MENKQISLQYIIGTIIKRRWVVIIPFVVSLVLSVILCFTLPKEYIASALILVNTKKMADPISSQNTTNPDLNDELKTFSKQVLAWPRLEQLIAQLHMADNITNQIKMREYLIDLQKRITVEMKGKELLEITYYDTNPELAYKVVNTVSENFIQENLRSKKEEAQNAIEFISEQLKIYRNKLENSQKNFSSNKVESDLKLAFNKKKLLEERVANLQKLIPSQITKEQSPVIARFKEQQAKYEEELARLMIDARSDNPRVLELQKLTKELSAKIEAEQDRETVKESISVMNPTYLQAIQDLKQTEMDIQYLLDIKKELSLNKDKKEKTATQDELSMLERNKKVDEDLYQMLLKSLESASVSERLQDSEKGSRFTIIEYARMPLEPEKPKKLRVILMGLFGGLCLGFGLVYLIEYFDKSFLTVEDAAHALPKQVLGTVSKMLESTGRENLVSHLKDFLRKHEVFSFIDFIAAFKLKKPDSSVSPFVVMYNEPHSIVAEEHRVARTNLLNFDSNKSLKMIMITSTLTGEGKSITSSNLAVAMANTGKNTILVDCDLRKGTTHSVFGIKQSPGVVDILKGKVSIAEALVDIGIPNLKILPRGSSLSNPSEILSSDNLSSFFETLKTNYDIAIIDTPPVLNLPDTIIIGKHADGVVMVVQMERTQRSDVMNAYKNLVQSNTKVLGFMLTNLRYYIPRYMYNHYYGQTYN